MNYQCYLNTERHMPAVLTLAGNQEEIFPCLLEETSGYQREVFPFGFSYELPALQRQIVQPVFLLDRRIAIENEHRFLHHREEDTVLLYSDEAGWRRIELQITEYDYDLSCLVSYADSRHPEPQWILHEGELVDVPEIAQRFFAISCAEDICAF